MLSPELVLVAMPAGGDGIGQSVRTDAGGAFVFGNLVPGRYEVSFRRKDGPAERLQSLGLFTAGGATADVRVEVGASLVGRIVDAAVSGPQTRPTAPSSPSVDLVPKIRS